MGVCAPIARETSVGLARAEILGARLPRSPEYLGVLALQDDRLVVNEIEEAESAP